MVRATQARRSEALVDRSDSCSRASHVIRLLFQQRARHWQEILPEEITGPQFSVLNTLRRYGAMDQRTLGEYASLDKSTAAPLIERLRRRDAVDVVGDPTDGRRKLISLTDAGRALHDRLEPYAADVDDRLLEDLTPAEREQFFYLASRILCADAKRARTQTAETS